MAGIDDAMLALDFDLACTIRINQHDADQDKHRAKMTAYYCIAMFNGEDPDDNADNVIPEQY